MKDSDFSIITTKPYINLYDYENPLLIVISQIMWDYLDFNSYQTIDLFY